MALTIDIIGLEASGVVDRQAVGSADSAGSGLEENQRIQSSMP